MSLLDDEMEKCTLIDKRRVPDGYGGAKVAWVDSINFDAAIILDTSTEARIAEKQGVTNLYTVTTKKTIGKIISKKEKV